MTRIIPKTLFIVFLAACCAGNIPLLFTTPIVSPSSLPAILSPTPPFISSATSTPIIRLVSPTFTETPSITPTEISTATITPTSTLPATPTPSPTQPSELGLDILGCNTSLDILHQMGEVTNAYPVVRNSTRNDLTNVCATLSASDEARVHPDKTDCVAVLPAGDQVVLKLTVDTSFSQDTAIQVVVTTIEGLSASGSGSNCRDIGLPGWLPDSVGMIEPIQ